MEHQKQSIRRSFQETTNSITIATKKKNTQRHLTEKETRKLKDAVDKARRMAWNMAHDDRYYDATRKYIASLLRNLEKAQREARWARMSNFLVD